jgi:hypothetical protein
MRPNFYQPELRATEEIEMSAPSLRGALKSNITIGGENGGELVEGQSIEWIQMVVPRVQILQDADIITMYSPTERLERIGFLDDVTYPDVAGQAAADGEISDWNRSKVELEAKYFRINIFLDYKVQAENRARGNIGTIIRDMTLDAAQRGLQKILLLSDTTDISLHARYQQIDGFLAQATNAVYTPDTAEAIDDDVLLALRNGLADEFIEDLPNMRYLMSRRMESAYGAWLKNNPATALGNFVTQSTGTDVRDRMEFMGIPIRYLSYMPDDTILLTNRLNMKVGFFVKMYLETFRDIDAGVDKYIMRYAVDCKFAHPEGVAKATNITIGTAIAGTN